MKFGRRGTKGLVAAACVAAAGFASPPAGADVRLPRLVGDNMVLQRDQPLHLWGFAARGETVRVEFRGYSAHAVADAQGRWGVNLPAQPAGGPDILVITGHNMVKLDNVLVGDVWVASGQSNMEFSLKEADGAAAAIAAARDADIRLFKVPHDVATQPKHDLLPGTWQVASPDSVRDFSAVAYLFARDLHERYRVPIGVIEANWGGTYIESWMSPHALQAFPDYTAKLRELERFTPEDVAVYEHYVEAKAHWNALHRAEDRGTPGGHPRWAEPQFEASGWPTIDIPRPDSAWGADFDGFDGTIWYRRGMDIPPTFAGQDLELHLAAPFQSVHVYYDGEPAEVVSETAGVYRVGGERVHAGHSVIVQRLTGGNGYIMLSGRPEDVYARSGDVKIPLAGPWSYQPGTELAEFPKPPPLALYYGFPGVVVLSNAMIEPLTPYGIKGAIWYQGESNVGAAELYGRLFPAMIRDWRRRWGSEFPFLFVQLAGYSPDPPLPGDSPWAELREAQEAALLLPHTGMATAVDIGNEENVHPKNKRDVAARLALAARHVAYGETVLASGPTFHSLEVEGNKIRIHYDHVGGGLRAKDRYGYPRGFAIAPVGGPFVWAKAVVDGDSILVWSDAVKQPASVRYGWANTPDGNLYNGEGLPAIPFRSDQPGKGP